MANNPQTSDQSLRTEKKEDLKRGPEQIVMHAQYVKDLSFEHPNAPQTLLNPGVQPNVEVGVNVMASRIDDDRYEVILKLTASAINDNETLFLVDLSYAGIVLVTNVDPQNINPLVMIQGPQLLFPFARAIISNVTREGGFMPLNINPIDFVAVYRHNVDAKKREAKGETT